jgi:hypothetical protein
MSELEARQGKRANAVLNGDFVCIETYSGRGLLGRDPNGARHLLSTDVEDTALGAALLDAVHKSRFLSSEDARTFLDRDQAKQVYEEWVQGMLDRYAYKSRRNLFKDMACCNIKLIGDTIVISPTSHPRLEAWEGLGDDQSIIISHYSAANEVGAALRLAFGRCEI